MIHHGDHIVDHVDAFLHEALAPGDMAYVRQHCEHCQICRLALEEADQRWQALDALGPIPVPEPLIQSTLRHIQQARTAMHRRRTIAWGTAAAVLLVAAGMHVYYATLAPSPYDLRILGQSEWMADTRASLRVVLWDRLRDAPLENVPIEVGLQSQSGNLIRLASFRTNRFGSGTPVFQLPDEAGQPYQLVVRAGSGQVQETLTRQVKLKHAWQVMFSTDKPLYQPGQTVHMRCLALARGERKPVAARDVVFSVKDPKGNVLFRGSDVTSRFGIASVDCPLAQELAEGTYQLGCQVGDTISTVTIEVRRYVLPKIKLEVELDKPFYQPGARAQGTVRAAYFFGKPVANARVHVEAKTTDATPVSLAQVTLQTDNEGAAAFAFPLPEARASREKASGNAPFEVIVTVQDAAGQTQTTSLQRMMTANAIRVEVIPESGTLVRGISNNIYFLTTYPDGRPAKAHLEIIGVKQELQTGDLGVVTLELTPDADSIEWTVCATDDQGWSGRKQVTLTCGRSADDFLVRTDQAVYAGGETLTVSALGGRDGPIFIDVIKDGQTRLTDQFEMARGRGQYKFDLPPEFSGTVEICAYRYGSDSLPIRKSRIVYLQSASELRVRTEVDRSEYRPGDSAQVRFTVTDAEGRPAPAALSLAAVDEAVFSVTGANRDLPSTRIWLDDELLKPAYAIYDWSPNAVSSALPEEQDRLEQAIFSRAADAREEANRLLKRILDASEDADLLGPRLSQALSRPDGMELAERIGGMTSQAAAVLRGERTSHTLSVNSFPMKSQQTERLRARRLELMRTIWVGVVVIVGIALMRGYGATITLVEVLIGLVTVGILISLLLPAVQSAREASRRASAMNDLKQFGLAAAVFAETEFPTGGSVHDSDPPPLRIRKWFPETLLWRPELITDDAGQAQLKLELADSITTWRLSAAAVGADGQLGGAHVPIRSFQSFFVELDLPVALTRGDEVALPAVVYNYLDEPQIVELALTEADWYESLDRSGRKLDLASGEVKSTTFRIRVLRAGQHSLQVKAQSAQAADVVRREIEIVPDGRRVEQVHNGILPGSADFGWTVPDEAIDGSVRALVKVYPSSFSQLVEGLDTIFQRPHGCFEQTSSTTYPNVLALEYLKRTNQNSPAVEAKARQYIHLGYQRLLGFEVTGGGFDWFGNPPAHRLLTAYGLMEFADMARVYDVDPAVINRTRQWLLESQREDGSWSAESQRTHSGPEARGDAELTATAYVAWAVFSDRLGPSVHSQDARAQRSTAFLLSHLPDQIRDPYTLALVANALLTLDRSGSSAAPYLRELPRRSTRSDDGKLVWWVPVNEGCTVFFGAGRARVVETTAMAALALVRSGQFRETSQGALHWLINQRDASGLWPSTQATVLALQSLIAGSAQPSSQAQPREIELLVGGKVVRHVHVAPDQTDVLQQFDITSDIVRGANRLTVREKSDRPSTYQVMLAYHIPGNVIDSNSLQPLSIRLEYDRTQLAVDEAVTAQATVENHLATDAPMVLLDLPIPGGFEAETRDFEPMVNDQSIARFQVRPRSVLVYLRNLSPGRSLVLSYRLRAMMPVQVTAPPAHVYEYYDPDKRDASKTVRLTVTQK